MKSAPYSRISLIKTVTRFLLCIILALAFTAPFVALTASASVAACAMACCADKNSDHCSSGVSLPVTPPTDSEVLCGSAEATNKLPTIVAEETTQSSTETTSEESNVATVAAVSPSCLADCNAGLVQGRRSRPRDTCLRSIVISYSRPNAFSATVETENVRAAKPYVTHQPSRGPPANAI